MKQNGTSKGKANSQQMQGYKIYKPDLQGFMHELAKRKAWLIATSTSDQFYIYQTVHLTGFNSAGHILQLSVKAGHITAHSTAYEQLYQEADKIKSHISNTLKAKGIEVFKGMINHSIVYGQLH